MSLRRFLNLVTINRESCIYSLRRLDLSSQSLFYPTTPAAEQKKLDLQEMDAIRIPPPSISFIANPSPFADDEYKMHCFGASENKIICTDQSGFSFLYDAGLGSVVTLPSLHTPKWCPISFSVPDPDEQDGDSRLYIIEKSPRPRPAPQGQFEAFVYTRPDELYDDKFWSCHSLPPPPFILQPGYDESTRIRSHALLGGGSHLCMSFTGIGTYCFDVASKEWSRAGDWMLPIFGKAEYVPGLNLWFGMSTCGDRRPCVSDLSSALNGEKPELSCIWKNYFPPEWNTLGLPQIISLGSGRLCVLDFFRTMFNDNDNSFAVFTGVELLPFGQVGKPGDGNGTFSGSVGNVHESGNGSSKQGFQMISHKSSIYRSGGTATLEDVL